MRYWRNIPSSNTIMAYHGHFGASLGMYLEDHLRYRKWLGSPPFISYEKAIWKGNNPILTGLTNWDDPPSMGDHFWSTSQCVVFLIRNDGIWMDLSIWRCRNMDEWMEMCVFFYHGIWVFWVLGFTSWSSLISWNQVMLMDFRMVVFIVDHAKLENIIVEETNNIISR